MVDNKGFDILDYLILIVRWKKLLILLFLSSLVVSYLAIYFLVQEEFESTAVVIPTEDSQLGAISGMMKSLKDLPLGLGGKSKNSETDLYSTIIYSRTSLENLVRKFNLQHEYKVELMDEAVKILRKKVSADVADDNSFRITVRASSPKKAAEMVNYILSYLNEYVIKLNVSKSKNNREFLEKRYQEIKRDLKYAEDSLQIFQQRSGILDAKEQPRIILNNFSKLENEIMTKKIEFSIMEKMVAKDSPQLNLLRTQLNEYQATFSKLIDKGDGENLLQPLNILPEKTKEYIRYYRNVEIYNTILEFLVPLYEQAKFEEQKDMPILQIIDYGNVPQKRIYPQRTLLSLIISVVILLFAISILIIREFLNKSNNPKLKMIKNEFFSFSKNSKSIIGHN
ncbi:MAG: hypothetical protein Q8933_07945 [Bacteroidota bacterium]|nr:hypothetical protein [Bacteroidota bacterium]